MWKKRIGGTLLLLLVAAAVVTGAGMLQSLKPARTYEPTSEEETEAPEEPSEEEELPAPTKEEVLSAREKALEGMTEEQAGRLTEVVAAANLWWEGQYLNSSIFEKLEDPGSLTWNYFDQTGEIQIAWSWDGSLSRKKVCEEEGLTEDQFYEKYGTKVVTINEYGADGFIALIDDLLESVRNEALRTDLKYIQDETLLAKRTHRVEHANNLYKALHDLDYFLLRYGPTIDENADVRIRDKSTVSRYYGMLSAYNG